LKVNKSIGIAAVVGLSAIAVCFATPTKAITAEEAISAIRAFDEFMTKMRHLSPQPQPTMPRATQPALVEENPSVSEEQPALVEENPSVSEEQPAPIEENPSNSEEEPVQQGD
jgi:hypothetical protein